MSKSSTPGLALVTGGTRGIGKAIAIGLQNQGYRVVVNFASNMEAAQQFTQETGIKAYSWNVADFFACEQGIKQIEAELGQHVEILVNNAGITRDKFLHRMDPGSWKEVIDTNLTSVFNMCAAVINQMRDHKFGRIINISSINANGQVGQTNYAAAKAGLLGFTKALALESAPKNITVNVVSPGYVETDMVKAVKPEILAQIVEKIPVKRLGQPEEIARCVAFLASEDAGFITGADINANGGQRMG